MTKNGIDSKECAVVVNGPYDFAIVVSLENKNENGRAKTANVTTSVKEGLRVKDAVPALSAASVRILMELAGEKKKKQAKILTAYMEQFVDAAAKLAGEDVMNRVSATLEGGNERR
ncbi:MAG: hypothetical protein HFG73_08480 [Hungatella sp.]|nr:hypothetical protein [Hungatella sp.]